MDQKRPLRSDSSLLSPPSCPDLGVWGAGSVPKPPLPAGKVLGNPPRSTGGWGRPKSLWEQNPPPHCPCTRRVLGVLSPLRSQLSPGGVEVFKIPEFWPPGKWGSTLKSLCELSPEPMEQPGRGVHPPALQLLEQDMDPPLSRSVPVDGPGAPEGYPSAPSCPRVGAP